MRKDDPQVSHAQGDLDPADWDAFETQVNRLLSAVIEKMRSAHEGPVWTPPPDDLKAALAEPIPIDGLDLSALATRLETLLPYGVGNTHPRFFGWVHGSGAPGNMLAELIGAAMNANCGGRDHVAIYVERQVIEWCKSLFGFPDQASGLIVSGTSMATIIAAKTARDAALAFASRTEGAGAAKLVGYVSEQAHSCLARAFDMIGLGTDALRKVAVTPAFEIDVEALKAQIRRDREAGFQPFFLAGNVGTVNTGAIDDLVALADLAAREGLWFHVDGAFGACAMTNPQIAPRLNGLERADSLAFDFHKWMHVNYDAGCVLVRDGAAHRKAFASRPDYLAADGAALAAGEPWPVDYGPELSRGFRALKVWAHLLEHGTQKIGHSIARNCDLAKYLAENVEAHPDFELSAPVSLNICCFRYRVADLSEAQLDDLNGRLVAHIQRAGIAAPSTTRLNGRLVIRVNITNHRTQQADMDILLDALAEGGASLRA
ncbi:MAG: pyridoxal-dependent decarboxylase [Pseudomonadota bacterium]